MRLAGFVLLATVIISLGTTGAFAEQCRHKVGPARPAADLSDLGIIIQVAPHVIVIDSDGTWITVHADIPYSSVDGSSVTLNGVPAALTKADLQGNLVAKFDQADIKAIVAPPEATLELTGLKTDGEEFAGSETVEVR
jgi:hypothetical protein